MVDPLKKREEFAVSLRKQKKIELIRNKRMKLMQNTAKMPFNKGMASANAGLSEE